MSSYFVVNASVTDLAKLNEYQAAVGPTLAGHELKILAATNEAETIEGVPSGSRVVILEFPSKEAFRAWYDSPAYQAVIGLRFAGTSGVGLLAEGL
jgi:uncharacterized protein (DUF1330 family)